MRHISRDQTQLRIHGRRADILPLLEVIFISQIPTTRRQPPRKVNLLRLLQFRPRLRVPC